MYMACFFRMGELMNKFALAAVVFCLIVLITGAVRQFSFNGTPLFDACRGGHFGSEDAFFGFGVVGVISARSRVECGHILCVT